MLNAKTMDAKFLSTLIGAGFGASALEGDGDLVGATIGLGVGAFAGSQMNLDLPKTDRYLQRNQTIRINNKPVAEIEKIRSELLEKITKQPATGFDFLESNNISFNVYGLKTDKLYRAQIVKEYLSTTASYLLQCPTSVDTVAFFTLVDATDIKTISDEKDDNNNIYNLMGHKIKNIDAPGFYIVDGKKTFVRKGFDND